MMWANYLANTSDNISMFLWIKQLFTSLPLHPIYVGLHKVHYKQNPFKCLQQQTHGIRDTVGICASCSRVLV